ncbi:MAG: energy-coupling factor ABC transporter ATP-binding protein [Pelosinus sp.]|nr:energy-coupling factor ABC transporter ATP-binding protein [Pelosinus sp.]
MLELKHVIFSYKAQSTTIQDVSFTIKAGEFVGIVGQNGSGKTTLTRLIMTLKKPTSGELYWQNSSMKNAVPAKMAQHIGYIFQNPDRQIFHDTVFEEVAYGPKQLGFPSEKINNVVDEALEATGLSHLAKAYPLSLSRGQKQRLSIAAALSMQPKMLILDEPTSGQDACEREKILKLLLKLLQNGTTILLVTHDMELLAQSANRAIVMLHGRKVFDGSVSELFQNSQLVAWGLSQPASLKISKMLAAFGVAPTCSTQELGTNIVELWEGK